MYLCIYIYYIDKERDRETGERESEERARIHIDCYHVYLYILV